MHHSSSKLQLLQDDPWLEPYTHDIEARLVRYQNKYHEIEKEYGSLEEFANGYLYLGITFDVKSNGWYYREWAPVAHQLFFIGDFNQWDRGANPMKKNEHG